MQSYLHVPVQRLPHAEARGTALPAYQSEAAAGLDLHACLAAAVILEPGAVARIPTGHAFAIPEGHEGQVRPRSGLSTKHRVTVPNAPGTIDADYRGEVEVALHNLGDAPYAVEPNARIAQLVVVPIPRVVLEPVAELPETVRGSAGFGSSGV
ncbi:dUTP diphosphatase [Phycisphaera mikurensis]|uniref:Deoxyuridine 5'-triphosphate nucleotidohydrolase n=1 Tax=Phycisphaera mikurensis (strain NBRC 102666 / KCTC 22515 / FYK2301M01) TaxID=1142394 RepID=I0IFE5_PHYMF|nr:dUTP diphosphatase [Phycisphaera mikurensis]MBB6440624.1 dUTP pyrophosphatase [Phycisphaera mikurensis]BAM03983.1 deoxyuridine 5'-triphosphate nucleotidohydrolase [Phycisphaera mikurensis NBRC 102666]